MNLIKIITFNAINDCSLDSLFVIALLYFALAGFTHFRTHVFFPQVAQIGLIGYMQKLSNSDRFSTDLKIFLHVLKIDMNAFWLVIRKPAPN